MPKSIQHIGPIEAASNLDSVVDGDGAAIDFDATSGFARFTAKGGAGASRGAKFRTLLAGVVVDAIVAAANGAIALIAQLTVPSAIVGTDPGGIELVRVGGSGRFLNQVSIGGGVTIRGNANYPGGAADLVASGSVANLATLAIGDATSLGVAVIATNNAETALVNLRAGLLAVGVLVSHGGTFGTAAGAANDYNVYWDAGSSKYRIENRSGTTRTFNVYRIGAFSTQ